MVHQGHITGPEIWFRPGPEASLDVLCELIETGRLTATVRIGKRGSHHPKGYVRGQEAILRVLDEHDQERLVRTIRIEEVKMLPVRELDERELKALVLYKSWQEIQAMLSRFEGRQVADDEFVSVITYAYL